MNDTDGAFLVAVVFGLAILFYFLPAMIGAKRDHKNMGSIFVLNLLLGWTFVGWVVAMVWAFSDQTPVQTQQEPKQNKPSIPSDRFIANKPLPKEEPKTKECTFCAETIKLAAVKCRYCGSDLSEI